MMKNKKAATYQTFFEVMLFSVLFVIALGVIGSNFNEIYGTDKDLTFGIATETTLANIKTTSNALESSQTEGQSSSTSLGLFTITTVPAMMSTIFGLIKDFVLGGWIAGLVNLMNLGDYSGIVIVILQILYFAILIFILIKLIVRMVV